MVNRIQVGIMMSSSLPNIYIHRKTRMAQFCHAHNLPVDRNMIVTIESFGKPATKTLKTIQKYLHLPTTGVWSDKIQSVLFPVIVSKDAASWALWYVEYQKKFHNIRYLEDRPMHLVRPPKVYLGGFDCSWFVTQLYWNSGYPDPNGLGYNGSGNTSSLLEHGFEVNVNHALPNDLAFYANPEHVAICIGDNKIVSMGHQGDPSIEYLVGNYRPVQTVRRYQK
jgi:cell wall-associated NlpC family hydrolase